MNLLARAVLSGSTDVVAHMYVIRLPWWVLPAVVVAIAAALAVIWLVTRRRRPRR